MHEWAFDRDQEKRAFERFVDFVMAQWAKQRGARGLAYILVGDSVAMVVLGYGDTLQVTIADMVHHVGAVARTRPIGAFSIIATT